MVILYNAAVGIKSEKTGDAFSGDVKEKLCNKPFEVVLACRRMIAEGYKTQGGIQELSDSYTMGWALPEKCTKNSN